jgi:spermidine/putrescine transport system substrate-binding protein
MSFRNRAGRTAAAVWGGAALLFGAALTSASCGKARPVLSVYTWSDYIKPDLVRRFEREHGCRVVLDTFVDKTMDHSVPYMIVVSGIAYLEGRVKDVVPSWRMFGRTDLAGRMTMFNDMRETIGAALKALGYSINSTSERELAEAEALALAWKRNIAKYDNEQYKIGLASGEFLLVHAWNGDVFQVRKENPDVRFLVPREGTVISCDDLVIPVDAREPALAHAFIDFLHDPAVAAENTEAIYYLCPNRASYPLLPAEIRDNPGIFLAPELRAKSEMIADIGAANALYIKVWDRLKAAR